MTIEEAVKIIESVGPDSSVYGWRKVADAFNLAIKALENQPKYENALELAVRDSDKSGTDVWCEDCGYEEYERLNKCWECGMKYYKRKAGLEVADD
jgi:uncharacterized paraquat-inducible protein A